MNVNKKIEMKNLHVKKFCSISFCVEYIIAFVIIPKLLLPCSTFESFLVLCEIRSRSFASRSALYFFLLLCSATFRTIFPVT